jgi:hypothetical protein
VRAGPTDSRVKRAAAVAAPKWEAEPAASTDSRQLKRAGRSGSGVVRARFAFLLLSASVAGHVAVGLITAPGRCAANAAAFGNPAILLSPCMPLPRVRDCHLACFRPAGTHAALASTALRASQPALRSVL